MTNEEAIKTLREDYCGNRIICELHPDQCNREDCEIWLAIKALVEQPVRVLETQPDGDCISRAAAIDAIMSVNRTDNLKSVAMLIMDLPSAQPEITPDGTLNISINADVASVGRILLSQTGTQRGGLYYKDALPERCEECENFSKTRLLIPQPEIIRCRDCKYGEQDDDGWWYCRSFGCQVGEEDGSGFCANAERKSGD